MNFVCKKCGLQFQKSLTELKMPDEIDEEGLLHYKTGTIRISLSCPKCGGEVRHLWNLPNIIITHPSGN